MNVFIVVALLLALFLLLIGVSCLGLLQDRCDRIIENQEQTNAWLREIYDELASIHEEE